MFQNVWQKYISSLLHIIITGPSYAKKTPQKHVALVFSLGLSGPIQDNNQKNDFVPKNFPIFIKLNSS